MTSSSLRTPTHLARYVAEIVTLAMLYYGAAKLGLLFFLVERNVSLVWPPSGLALVALLLFGIRLWPGLVLGAFAATASTGAPLSFAVTTAIGNPLEAMAAVYLLRRVAKFDIALERIRDVLALGALGAALSSAVSATIGVTGLCASGMAPWSAFVAIWRSWWLGDVMGILVIAPLILTWAARPSLEEYRTRALEAGWLLIGTVLVCGVIYYDWLALGLDTYPLEYLVFPFLIWAGFRFGPRGASVVALVVVALAVWSAAHNQGPFASGGPSESLFFLWCFIAVVAMQSMFIAAAVSEREQARRAALASERQVRIIIDKVPALITYVDPDLGYRFVNQAFAEWHGVDIARCQGKPMREVVDTHTLAVYERHLERALAGEEVTAEAPVPGSDGTMRYVGLACVPHTDERGRVAGVIQVIVDITRRKQEEQALQQAKDNAEATARAKSLFLANMSHEIRTPINGMLGIAELLRDTGLDAEQREYIDILRRCGDTLLSIVNNTLDLSKLEAGRIVLEHVEFDLEAAIRDVLDVVAESAHSKKLELRVLIDPKVPPWVAGDPGRLRQILVNLVGNAVKFTAAGEVVVRARLAEEDAHTALVRIEVSDTGIGIAPNMREQLFEPFFQADASTTRQFGGTGLGLAIARELAERMGGSIGVDSEMGQGSTFWFTVRLSKRTAAPRNAAASANADALANASRPPPLARARILLVEDNGVNQKVAASMLEKKGFRVSVANNGQEALEAYKQILYDLIIMDCQMPHMDGYEATRRIRAYEAKTGRHVPIIAMTAHALQGDRERCIQAGMDDYLSKPVTDAQLAATLERWVAARPGGTASA